MFHGLRALLFSLFYVIREFDRMSPITTFTSEVRSWVVGNQLAVTSLDLGLLGVSSCTCRKFLHAWDPLQVLLSGHGTEATDTDVKARGKSAVNQLGSVGGRWIV